jgi:sugar lactone lactonase YvrE
MSFPVGFLFFIWILGFSRVASTELFVQVIAGEGVYGYDQDNQLATNARLAGPRDVWADTNGNSYIVDSQNQRIRRVDGVSGMITTIMGIGTSGYSATLSAPATSVPLFFPMGIAGDTIGQFIYISDVYHIWKYDITSGIVGRYAGLATQTTGLSGNDGQAADATFGQINRIWLTTTNILYLTDSSTSTVRKILANGIIKAVSGGGGMGLNGDGLDALHPSVTYFQPQGVYVDSNDVIFIADTVNARIRYINNANIVNTYAGGGSSSLENILATTASLNSVFDVCGDTTGNIYIVAGSTSLIFKVTASGIINVYLGAIAGGSGVTLGTVPANSRLSNPLGVYYDKVNDILYETESGSNVLRKTLFVTSPTSSPSTHPVPSIPPSSSPSVVPSSNPSSIPSLSPTLRPSARPTCSPTAVPSDNPSTSPTAIPFAKPTSVPSAKPTTLPTAIPFARPTSVPSAKSTAPSFAPTLAPNVNDKVNIYGETVISGVNGNVLNNQSMTTVTEALKNISGSAREAKVTTIKLLNKKGRSLQEAVQSHSFKIAFVTVYYLSYYSGWNSSYVAEIKLKTMKEAVEDGSFQNVLRSLATVYNASQLLNVTCDEITLSTSIIDTNSDSSSSSSSDSSSLTIGVTAAVVVCSIIGAGLFIFLFVCFLYRRDNHFAKVAVTEGKYDDGEKDEKI